MRGPREKAGLDQVEDQDLIPDAVRTCWGAGCGLFQVPHTRVLFTMLCDRWGWEEATLEVLKQKAAEKGVAVLWVRPDSQA